MVVAKQVKEVVSPGELAIRIEKRWITCDSLIQQLGPLERVRSFAGFPHFFAIPGAFCF